MRRLSLCRLLIGVAFSVENNYIANVITAVLVIYCLLWHLGEEGGMRRIPDRMICGHVHANFFFLRLSQEALPDFEFWAGLVPTSARGSRAA
ncbi:hypothetical protein BX666DRAFT_1988054 [Dichotomocladium elegans]|nr:hypothetical protein BX666DRAFT_1988054 [Dichotomocladium elegans]